MRRALCGFVIALGVGLLVAACAGPAPKNTDTSAPQWAPRNDNSSLLEAANAAYFRGDYRESNRLLAELIQRLGANDPNVPILYSMRALNNMSLEMFGAALRDINRAHALSPGDPAVLRTRGEIYVLTKRYNEAVTDLSAALRVEEHEDAYFTRASAYIGLERFSLARDDMLRYVRLQPDDSEGWYRLGLLSTVLEDDETALAAFYVTLGLDSSNREAREYMAELGCPYRAYARDACS